MNGNRPRLFRTKEHITKIKRGRDTHQKVTDYDGTARRWPRLAADCSELLNDL